MNRIIEPDETELEFSRIFPQIVLASKSENRRGLLECGGSKVYQIPMDTEEERENKEPMDTVLAIARNKMKAYLESERMLKNLPALSADTLVLFEGELIGKAGNEDEARATLKRFSGKKQTVISASVLFLPSLGTLEFVDTSDVYFKELDDAKIDEYILTGDWVEAAGSYRLQRNGWNIVERIDGDWTTVVGLPMRKIIDGISHGEIL